MTVTGHDPRQQAVDAIEGAWNAAIDMTVTPDERFAVQAAMAQASALIYVGDTIARLMDVLIPPADAIEQHLRRGQKQ